jgi:hypothetical protein
MTIGDGLAWGAFWLMVAVCYLAYRFTEKKGD